MHTVDDESHSQSAQPGGTAATWQFRLYVAGQSPRSVAALANLRSLCTSHLPGLHSIVVLDLTVHPELASQDSVIVLPTLVKVSPKPTVKLIGDLSNTTETLKALGLDR